MRCDWGMLGCTWYVYACRNKANKKIWRYNVYLPKLNKKLKVRYVYTYKNHMYMKKTKEFIGFFLY